MFFRILGQFHTSCRDRHATAVGYLDNAFRPRCQCFGGFESSNPLGEKFLLQETDVCIRCSSDDVDCGFAPTVFPSDRPTISSAPSTAPSSSQNPSSSPSISLEPSGSPTTLEPAPSLHPTVRVTLLGGLFDGDSCRFSSECKSGKCQGGICDSKVCM